MVRLLVPLLGVALLACDLPLQGTAPDETGVDASAGVDAGRDATTAGPDAGSDTAEAPDVASSPDAVTADVALDAPLDAPILSGWAYRREVTIDNSAFGSLQQFPVLLALTPANFTFAAAQNKGQDVRVTDASGNLLAYEIEAWSPTQAWVWVGVPTIAGHAPTTLWLYYGNPAANDAQNATGVWDSSFVGVWHLADAHDSTGKNNSSNHGATAATGQVGPASAFDGNGHYIDTGTTQQLPTWTVEAWTFGTRAPSQAAYEGPVIRGLNYGISWDCHPQFWPAFRQATGASFNTTWQAAQFGTLATSTWYLLAGTYDGTTISAYQNGGPPQTTTHVGVAPDNDTVSAEIAYGDTAGAFFAGTIDEVRISSVARSPDWIDAEYSSMAGSYVLIGPEVADH